MIKTRDKPHLKNVYRGGSKRYLQDKKCEYCNKQFRPKGSCVKFCSTSCVYKDIHLRAILRIFKNFYVDKNTGCWIWKKRLNIGGYAICTATKGLSQVVHKTIFMLFFGEVLKGKQLDHLCRNRKCVNPFHLEVVSTAENVRRGLSTKLNKKIINNIFLLSKQGKKQVEIAKMFKLNQSHISRILNKKRWETD